MALRLALYNASASGANDASGNPGLDTSVGNVP
jgi:hypothetical protein